ncbi:uncharacterized protein LOC118407899 [Branchiostoma floridae]|uniref:Uncharacterized protein LOC118407899 n=1 Tax=Branchiostoma floridae TaxID=7739 RepID=A0A9J7HUM4_BRAFL|nr:uncharacterized protein LOC118407899 [Branchiostoma floridae]
MAGLPPDMFYLVQRNEILTLQNRQLTDRIAHLEYQFQQTVQEHRRQLAQKEVEKSAVQREVERLGEEKATVQREVERLVGEKATVQREVETLRAQLPEVRDDGQPKRKRKKMNDTEKPYSALRPSSLRGKRGDLRERFLEPAFRELPRHIVKANVTFRTEDGFCLDVEWPQGLYDRRNNPPPAQHVPVTGRGYRHQTEETKDLVRWCVHFKDQASVSDVWWHELHMKFPKVIPPIGWVREERVEQNSFLPYQMEENARDGNGASRSVKEIITHHLQLPENQHLLEADEPVVSFRYGVDGRPQAKNTVIGAVMACITPVRDLEEARRRPRLVRDEYCVFVYSGKESYEEQVQSGSRVFREMEDLQQNGLHLKVGEEEDGQDRTKHVKINWYILSDWKALAEMMGLVGPTGKYFCVLCYCTKEHLSRFSQDFSLRTHDKAAQCIRDRDKRGHQKLPVMSIPWGNVIIDTLHMYLRIGGKLLTQLIGWVIDQNVPEKLEQAMRDVGVGTFYLREEGNRQGTNTFKWKSLSAKELKKAIKMLPDRLPDIIENVGITREAKIDSLQGRTLTAILQSKGAKVPHKVSERKALLKELLGGAERITVPGRPGTRVQIQVADIQEIWREFSRIMDMPKDPRLHNNYKAAARQWVLKFRDTTYLEDCTPYMHYFACHAGDQLQEHPFLHYVNCETIEKKNHVQTRRYHLATQKGGGRNHSKWAEQLMQMENRETFAAIHGIGQREKRKWTRRAQPDDPGYGGGSASDSDSEESTVGSNTDELDGDDDDDDRIVYDGEEDD